MVWRKKVETSKKPGAMALMKIKRSSRHILSDFPNHVEPKCSPVFSFYKSPKRVPAVSETMEQFVTDLKLLVREC